MTMASEHVDVLIVGAGLSGIGMAVHLTRQCPAKTYAILEARNATGGTWDLFRYPGVRSDSDMFTLGYNFKPWTGTASIAEGVDILAYIREAAREHGVERRIRLGHKVKRAAWSTATSTWTLDVERDEGGLKRFTCGMLIMCSGYYRTSAGYEPSFPGAALFAGRIVHPQQWTPDIATAGKTVVIIGSGATAVTLGPAIAGDAQHVTILQRSPTYIVPWPAVDPIAQWLRAKFSSRRAYKLTRAKNVLRGMYFYRAARKNPDVARQRMRDLIVQQLGPDARLDPDFTPRYNPWDQRVCLSPNADFFKAMKEGKLSMVTDEIETFTPSGIKLKSGRELPADVIVTATGLVLEFIGGVAADVDGRALKATEQMVYKGCMFRDVPNLITIFGYVNASWTLKADLVSAYACRLINHMDKVAASVAVPHDDDPDLKPMPWTHFSSGYFERAKADLPMQGSKPPWTRADNYLVDMRVLKFGRIDDGILRFEMPLAVAAAGKLEAAE